MAKKIAAQYTISFEKKDQQILTVKLNVQLDKATSKIVLQLPVWSPGSYLVREYSKNIIDIKCNNTIIKTDKNSYEITLDNNHNCQVEYNLYATELTVRTSHIDSTHAFIHNPSCFFEIKGVEINEYLLDVILPFGWHTISSSLEKLSTTSFKASNYDLFIDSPLEIGNHKKIIFSLKGVMHELCIYGNTWTHEHNFVKDIKKIYRHISSKYPPLPYKKYVTIIHLLPDIYGGLEHKNCFVAQFCAKKIVELKHYQSFLCLISHEYFHTWNIKRIRPIDFSTFDYNKENYTKMLWLAEGLTSFVDDLFVFQTKQMSAKDYLNKIKLYLNIYNKLPSRFVDSVEESSFDAWTKFYQQHSNSSNITMSYYLKGGLIFNLLHIWLIENNSHIDSFIQALWQQYLDNKKQGISKEEVLQLIEDLSSKNIASKFNYLLQHKGDLPFKDEFKKAGLELIFQEKPALGFTIKEDTKDLIIKTVFANSNASNAKLNPDDKIIAINNITVNYKDFEHLANRLKDNTIYHLLIERKGIIQSTTYKLEKTENVISDIQIFDKKLFSKVYS